MVKAVILVGWKKGLQRRERCFPSWRAFERFARGLEGGRWRRVYRAASGSYLEAVRPGLYLEVLAQEEA